MLQIKGYCSYFGSESYNIYSKRFFKTLKQLCPKISVGNFSKFSEIDVDSNDKKIVDEIITFDNSVSQSTLPHWMCDRFLNDNNLFSVGDVNIILEKNGHKCFYQKHNGIKIAYTFWDTQYQLPNFFTQLLNFDQLWVPTFGQKQLAIEQGYPENKIFVIPIGIDDEFLVTPNENKNNDPIQFLLVGNWSYSESTKEIIETFLNIFQNNENVELVLCVDDPNNDDGLLSTENRLSHYFLCDDRIKIKHFTNYIDYVEMMKKSDVLVSCYKGCAPNIPLLESLSLGKPTIFSKTPGQFDLFEEFPLGIDVFPPKDGSVYYQPNYEQLGKVWYNVYENLENFKQQHITLCDLIKSNHSLKNSTKKAMDLLIPILFNNVEKKLNEFYVDGDIKETLTNNDSTLNNFIYKEIFDYSVYNNSPGMRIQKNDTVVDIGAHIGIFSRYAATQGASRVISFEMNPVYFNCLKLNVRDEDDVFNCVMLDKNFVKFKLDNDILINGFNLEYFFVGGLFEKINFLKIDVMGKEFDFLNSMKKSTYDLIDKISVKLYNTLDTNKSSLIDFMIQNSFNYSFNPMTENQPIQFLYFWK